MIWRGAVFSSHEGAAHGSQQIAYARSLADSRPDRVLLQGWTLTPRDGWTLADKIGAEVRIEYRALDLS
jgi:hypothetical protein